MKKLNKKGFTLVELLAVIVILALLIVVVANTALPAMNNAKKNTLQVYAKRVVEQAKALYSNAEIGTEIDGCDDNEPMTCTFYDLADIMGSDVDETYTLTSFTIRKSNNVWNIEGSISGSGNTLEISTNSSTNKIKYNFDE